MNQYKDNTRLSDFKECQRKYYFRHVRDWRREGISNAIAFGLAWHDAMDAVWTNFDKMDRSALIERGFQAFCLSWSEQGLPIDIPMEQLELFKPRTPMVAKEMLGHYITAREHIFNKCKLIAVEQPFAVPLYPDRADCWYIGRMDKVIEIGGRIVPIEHKTTTAYKKDGYFKYEFLNSFAPNSQVEGYLYAGDLTYHNVREVWVDAALVHDKVHDGFKFLPITRTTDAMDAWLWETRQWFERAVFEEAKLNEIEEQGHKIMMAFPRNTGACQGKYGQCSYRDVCMIEPNPHLVEKVPEGFILEKWEPFDILGLDKLGMKKE